MTGQAVLLHRARVDRTTFLPQLGQVTRTVHSTVEVNAARTRPRTPTGGRT
ncbi:hypothetical protein [Streptomyces virginiae]